MSKFSLSSIEFSDFQSLTKSHEYNGFDGAGDNRVPVLTWSNKPTDTKSFAITMYDPDAPTGSGFWHWVAYDLDNSLTELNMHSPEATQYQFLQAVNDFGENCYGGPCPPKGDKHHRYIFTIHALNVEKLPVPETAPNAIVRFMINHHTINTANITSIYQRT